MVCLVYRYQLKTRSGEVAWTPEMLVAWIEVLTGETVQVKAVPRAGWFSSKKHRFFEIALEATAERARAFEEAMASHLKLRPLDAPVV